MVGNEKPLQTLDSTVDISFISGNEGEEVRKAKYFKSIVSTLLANIFSTACIAQSGKVTVSHSHHLVSMNPVIVVNEYT